jgi:hypothetical protein
VQTITPLLRLDLGGRALRSGDAHAGDDVDNSQNGENYFDVRNNTKAALNGLRTNVPSRGKALIGGGSARSWSRFTSWLRRFIVWLHAWSR